MVKLVIKTNRDVETMLNMALKLAESEDKYNVFYRTHVGFKNRVSGNNGVYSIDGDMINLRMLEILDYMKCECYVESAPPSEFDDEPSTDDWKYFMKWRW